MKACQDHTTHQHRKKQEMDPQAQARHPMERRDGKAHHRQAEKSAKAKRKQRTQRSQPTQSAAEDARQYRPQRLLTW